MELILTQLKDFSSKSATFNSQYPTEVSSCRYYQAEDRQSRQSLDIESALASLKKELMEIWYLDQMLIKQLMELHACIRDLKQEYRDLMATESDCDTASNHSSSEDTCPVVLLSGPVFHELPSWKVSYRRSSMP
ncbi:hypothetical protein KIL84_010817 [Mauremys mutica]|uniref:Uncharacterized protein n=1 Tax=Mauremys mutica TaxID=74926 RepID=A0A9D3XDC2_9SAUR|nr:hypothetical protein KIL84_010817 [Mauremys mutica]